MAQIEKIQVHFFIPCALHRQFKLLMAGLDMTLQDGFAEALVAHIPVLRARMAEEIKAGRASGEGLGGMGGNTSGSNYSGGGNGERNGNRGDRDELDRAVELGKRRELEERVGKMREKYNGLESAWRKMFVKPDGTIKTKADGGDYRRPFPPPELVEAERELAGMIEQEREQGQGVGQVVGQGVAGIGENNS